MIAALVILTLLAVLFGPAVIGLVVFVGRVAAGVVVLTFQLARLILIAAGYIAALLCWGVWLCLDHRGALEAYRNYPGPDGAR